VRIILYTGKGGVGKTSTAAATALRCARLGQRTAIMSTDPAHSLSDSLEAELGPEPVQVEPNLWGQEIDVYYSMNQHWAALRRYLAAVFSWRGVSGMLAEEVAVIPGMEEAGSLLWIDQHNREGKFDVLVVDCAPTAETLRLLSLPDVGRWWFERLFPAGLKAKLALAPIARPFMGDMPIPDRETVEFAAAVFDQLEAVHQLLADPAISSVRLVMNPEKMVIKEAQRTYTYLNLYGYVTDAVICNRVMPPTAATGYFEGWAETQARYVQMIEEAFAPLPILPAPYFEQEIAGPAMLERLALALFGEDDPARLYFQGQAYRIEQGAGGYELVVPLGFGERRDINLLRKGDELTLQVGTYRRSFILPHVLAGRATGGARFEDHTLRIQFK
jgi:arsenite/tail-anchored protein-transporting ATPase